MLNDYDYFLKLRLIGDSGVGKSSLILRFVDNTYTDSYISTIGTNFKSQTISVGDKSCKLQIWDSAGQEQLDSYCSNYAQKPHGILVIFDVSDWVSFSNAKGWVKKAKEKEPQSQLILVGCKSDLGADGKRVVDADLAQEYADLQKIDYIEVSAKSDSNVNKLFSTFSRYILKERYADSFESSQSKNPCLNNPDDTHFSVEDFLKELDDTVEKMYISIATRTFFKANKEAYEVLSNFKETYKISSQSTQKDIIDAMHKATRKCPEICQEKAARHLLEMTNQTIAGSCNVM